MGCFMRSVHNFYRKGLLPHNIGSNEGLAKVMRIQMQDMGLEPPGTPPTKYSAMLSDINIFDRVIKVTHTVDETPHEQTCSR